MSGADLGVREIDRATWAVGAAVAARAFHDEEFVVGMFGPDPISRYAAVHHLYRHESWADEATNKDASNLNLNGGGTITWTTDLHGCGPEARENTYNFNTCSCDSEIATPTGIGPINVPCTQ